MNYTSAGAGYNDDLTYSETAYYHIWFVKSLQADLILKFFLTLPVIYSLWLSLYIIDVIMRLVDPHTIMYSTPTFGMYSFLGKINKCNVVDVPRLPTTFGIFLKISQSYFRFDNPKNSISRPLQPAFRF